MSGLADGSGGNKIGTIGSDGSHYFIDLGPLQYNGGSTPTCALLVGSDAIDAGSNDYSDPQTTDQTGRNRIVNNQIDIGAYEFQPSGVDIQLVSSPSAAPGQVVTLTATVTPVTPGSNAPTGVVTFYYNDYDPSTFLAQVPVSNGKAVLSNVTIPAGATLVAAQYEGDSEFSGTNTQIDLPAGSTGGFHGGGGGAVSVTVPQAGLTAGTGTGTATSNPGGSTDALRGAGQHSGQFLQHSGQFLQHSGQFLQHSGQFLQHSGQFLQHSGQFLQHSGQFLQHSGQFLQHSGQFLQQRWRGRPVADHRRGRP